jgi:hypothetical protein
MWNRPYRMSLVANLARSVSEVFHLALNSHPQQCALITLLLFFKLMPSRISKIP